MAIRVRSTKKKIRVRKRKTGTTMKRRARRGGGGGAPTLDTAALKWARLLADPCGAEIVAPVYPGAGRGYQVRLKQLVTLPSENGFIEWCPASNSYTYAYTTSASTVFEPLVGYPAFNYLTTTNNNSNISFRPVAACMKVYPNDSEMNRSGILYLGHTNGVAQNYTSAGTSNLTINGIAGSLPYTGRMPDSTSEIIWLPAEGDADGLSYNVDNSNALAAPDLSNVCAAFTGGFTSALGVSVELIAVYEVNPGAGSGVQNSLAKPVSKNTLNDVLRFVMENKELVSIGVGMAATGLGFDGTVAGSYVNQTLGLMKGMKIGY